MQKKLKTAILALASLAVAPVAQAQDWGGFYGGVSVGRDQGDVDWVDNNGGWFSFAPGTTHSASANGMGGGMQVGYNWQFGNGVLAGVEVGITSLGNSSVVTSPLFPASDVWHTEVTNLGTATARVGFARGKWLPYVEGGLAIGDVAMTNRDSGFCAPPCVFRSRESQTGYVLGIGADYMAGENVSFGLNYRFADLGSSTRTGNTTGVGTAENYTVNATASVVSLRINFLLD